MSSTLHALAEPRRVEILRMVAEGERPAGEIAAQFADVSRPAISQHLRVLAEAGLLDERRDGRGRLYRLRADGFAELAALVDEFWTGRLAALRRAVEADVPMRGANDGSD